MPGEKIRDFAHWQGVLVSPPELEDSETPSHRRGTNRAGVTDLSRAQEAVLSLRSKVDHPALVQRVPLTNLCSVPAAIKFFFDRMIPFSQARNPD